MKVRHHHPLASRLACALSLAACGSGETEGRRVPVVLQVESAFEEEGSPSDFSLASGFRVHLDEARVFLGPVYLRAPRREASAGFWRILLPLARAHPEHAQTLTEGQILGEFLPTVAYDALSDEPMTLGRLAVQAGRLDRLSVMLSPSERGYVALVRGWAEREQQRVVFDCVLRVEQDADDTPENLEARRRVDQIVVDRAPRLRDGDTLVLQVRPWRWLERVDFDALADGAEPCADRDAAFLSQWYLGIRRPEAFGALLISED